MRLCPPLSRRGYFVLAAGALVAVIASGCQDTIAAPGVGASLQTTEALNVLPSDADVIGMMDLSAARESDALQAVTGGAGLEMLSPGGSAEFDAFVRQTGFDPGRDLDRVYVAAPAAGREEGRAAFVGYGRFSRERIERYLATQTEHPMEATDIEGVPAYFTTDDGRRGGFALPNDRMVLAGDEATLRQMLARMGTGGTAPAADVQALLDRVAFPDGAWFVARHLPDGPAGADDPAGLAARLAEGVAVSMDFGRDGVPVRAFVQTPQPADLADVLRGGVSAARIGAKDEPAFLSALDGVEVETAQGGVTVEAFLPTALLAEMHAQSGE